VAEEAAAASAAAAQWRSQVFESGSQWLSGQSRIEEVGKLNSPSLSSFPPPHAIPFLPPLFYLLSLLYSFPLDLEVGPLNTAMVFWGERCKHPQRGLGRISSRNRIQCI